MMFVLACIILVPLIFNYGDVALKFLGYSLDFRMGWGLTFLFAVFFAVFGLAITKESESIKVRSLHIFLYSILGVILLWELLFLVILGNK